MHLPIVVTCQNERRFKFCVNINCIEQQIAAENECKEDITKRQWMDKVARNRIKNKIEENRLEYEKQLKEFKADVDDKKNLSAGQKKNLLNSCIPKFIIGNFISSYLWSMWNSLMP